MSNARRGPFRVQRSMAAIVGRPTSIVLSFAQIRAIVGRHFVLFLEAHDPAVQDFARELADRYKQISDQNDEIWNGQEAMELIFLEEVLRNSVESFNRRLRLYDPIVNSFLEKSNSEVYSDTGVHQLVPLKDSLQSFEMHVKQCLDCLTQLLEDDEEMLALLLTEQAKARETGKPVDFQRHQHVELLLGVYARQINNTLMEIQFLLQRIQSKQEFVTLALAGYRNRMMLMNVSLSIATLSLCLATTVAGFFGMNVVNGFEESTTAFSTIVLTSTIAGLGLGAGSLNYLSGRTMQNRAAMRLGEIETLTGALSDMCALDYAVKSTLEHGTSITRDEFRTKLRRARQSGEVTGT
jgi:magnesium transporter